MLKNISIFFIILSNTCLAQTDSALLKRLQKPVINCETIATNSQEIIGNMAKIEFDSIYEILDIWQAKCGNNEPIERMKILLNIQKNTFIDTTCKEYILEYSRIYKNRLEATKESRVKQISDNYKGYFNYVPLGGRFDDFTKEIAQNLLKNSRLSDTEYLLCLLFSNDIERYDEALKSKKYENNFIKKCSESTINNVFNPNFSAGFSTGICLPSGRFSETFKVSPEIGASLGFQLKKTIRLDLVLIVRFPVNDKSYDIQIDGKINSVKSRTCITIGAGITKEIPIKNNFFLDINGGIGVGTMGTDLRNPNNNNANNNNTSSYYSAETVDLFTGISLRKKFKTQHSMALNLNYHFAPYNSNKILVTDIGNQFFDLTLSYRF